MPMPTQPMPKRLRFQDIDKHLEQRLPLYIRNKTGSKGVSSILVINYPSMEGDRAFQIPRTGICFNICDYVDPESLRASRSFREMWNKGAVEIVDDSVAEAELSDPARVESFRLAYEEANNTHKSRVGELEKARSANAVIREEQQRAHAGAMKNMITTMDPTLAKALNFVDKNGQRHEPKLIAARNSRLVSLESRIKGNAIDLAGVMSELQLMLGDLSPQELESIAESPTWPSEAQDWARERIEFSAQATQSTKR